MTKSGREADAIARILLHDSDTDNRAQISADLKSAAKSGSRIVTAENGRQANALLRGQTYDLVLLDLDDIDDIGLPREEAMPRLVRMAGAALVIFLSKNVSVSMSVAAMQAGAHDLMAKPVAADRLISRIQNLGRRHGLATSFCGLTYRDETPPLPANTPATSVQPAMFPRREPQILPMWQQEQRIIEDAITKFSGNIAQAAAALEISPSTIYRKRQIWEQMAVVRRGAA